MIQIIDGNLFDSKANFIVHQVNCEGIMGGGVALQVAKKYPHVKKEYMRYLNHCEKNHVVALGTCQFVPVDVWALPMVDTMRNDRVTAYDSNYQYIVNMFGQEEVGFGLQTDLKVVKKAFIDIRNKAQSIGASVAMPYNIGCCRGGANWNDMDIIIKKTFDNSDVDVEIWRLDMN